MASRMGAGLGQLVPAWFHQGMLGAYLVPQSHGAALRRCLFLFALLAVSACKKDDLDLPVPPGDSGTPVGTPIVDEACDRNYPNRTVGLLTCRPEASAGYTLFAPLSSTTTYLVDLNGKLVNSWESAYPPGEAVYLEPNGHLLRASEDADDVPFRAGGIGGRIEEFDWDGNLVWEFVYKGADHINHHDMTRLPNGNLVLIAWEAIDEATAEALGRNPDWVGEDGMWACHLIEVDPSTNEIVWEWHVLDHVIQERDPAAPNYGVLSENPGKVNIDRNWAFQFSNAADWNHVNGVDYNAALDQLAISAHNQDEIWILDHSTSTAQAASNSGGTHGRGGELLYRWGSPENYGMAGARQLSGQHDVEWIPEGSPGAGNLLIFNNGVEQGYSEVIELVTPLQPDGSYLLEAGQAYGPAAPVWSYGPPGEFFSSFVSGSQRLPNGNTLICDGDSGTFTEVTVEGEIVWVYQNPVGPLGPVEQGQSVLVGPSAAVFRADRYAPEYPAFEGRDMSPKGTVEL